jgi:hypothetical protein
MAPVVAAAASVSALGLVLVLAPVVVSRTGEVLLHLMILRLRRSRTAARSC